MKPIIVNPDEPIYQREGRRFTRVQEGTSSNGLSNGLPNGFPDEIAHRYQAKARSGSLPPIAFDSVREIMRGFASSFNGILLHSDFAIRENRKLQRMMRRDPDVMSPLFQRLYSIAELDWTITPPDQDDKLEMERAAHLKQLIDYSMRRKTEFFKQLGDACWYGSAAVNVIYDRVKVPLGAGIAPVAWKPLHSDSLEFNEFGELGMKVGMAFTGETLIGHDGRVRMFSEAEREAVILHVWNPEGPDFDEPREARYIYGGRGLRDILYNFWYMKQTALKLWMIWIQRYSMGNRIFTYPAGNASAKTEMEKASRNLANDTSLILPRTEDDPDAYSVKILEPNASQAKVFADLIDGYLGGQLKEMLIGQTATTEATATGLGSSVGTEHATTYQRIIKFDSRILADSLTWELIIPLYVMNFGESDSYPIFEFPIEEVESEKWMAGAEKFVQLGGAVSEKQVRERLGLDEPEESEPVLMGGGLPVSDEGFTGGALDVSRMIARREKYAKAMEIKE